MSVEKRLKDALLPFGDPVEKSFLYAAADRSEEHTSELQSQR